MVNPDPSSLQLNSQSASSYRTRRLQSPINNNKNGKSSPSPFLFNYSRKRSGNILPPLTSGDQRPRRSRVRTVPNSRANSSKHSKLDQEPVLGKRSRSASEEPFSLTGNHVSLVPDPAYRGTGNGINNGLEVRGTESLLQFAPLEDTPPVYTSSHVNKPRRLAKVETIRVLRARSALLLPTPSPTLSIPSSLSCQPLVLKSEDRKKKRR